MNEYALGAPLFQKATIHLENGNDLVINAPENSADNCYIQSLRLNGKNYTKNFYRHEDLLKGGKIEIEMSNTPNKNRGIKDSDAPYSFTNELKK